MSISRTNYPSPVATYSVCTSSTRPSSPAAGHMVFETDTNSLQVWSGTAWMPVGPLATWTAFTPTWTASTNPSIGNGTLVASYARFGTAVLYNMQLICGSTTTYGSGPWNFSLPVAGISGRLSPMAAFIEDSGTGKRLGTTYHLTTTLMRVVVGTDEVSSTVPMTWAVNDTLSVSGLYVAA